VSPKNVIWTASTASAPRPRATNRRVATAAIAGLVLSIVTFSPASAGDAPDPEPAPPGTGTQADLAASQSLDMAATGTLLATAPYMPPMAYNGEVRGVVGAWAGFTNGQIASSALCSPSWSIKRGRCDAIRALEQMNAEYRATFGFNMTLTSTYRTYEEQAALHAANPVGAAAPGTSNHGWGLAIDFGGGVNTYGSAQHNWLRSNANRFGWFQPSWAQYSGSLREPWHWEYAGAVASNRADQSLALAMELMRAQPWNSAAQQQCLTDLWSLRSGWDFRAVGAGDLRGISQAHMTALFGPYWASSSEATKWLQIPQRQIEWGLLDMTANFGNACNAWAFWSPIVTARATGPTTVPAGGVTSISVSYAKLGQAVPAATVYLQELRDGVWHDAVAIPITNGAGTLTFSPGATTKTYRVRNYNGGALTPPFTIEVAEVTATLTGPTTIPAGGETSLAITYRKDSQPVPAATVVIQKLVNGAWVDAYPVPVTNGTASFTFRLDTSATFRVRNHNTGAFTAPFTINVAEVTNAPVVTAALTGPSLVTAGATTTVAVTYHKDGAPVPIATVTLQEKRDGVWADSTPVAINAGKGTLTIRPVATTTYRLRNWNGAALSAQLTITVQATPFADVPDGQIFYVPIAWLAEQGITNGYGDGTFRPIAPMTREALAAFLYRLAGRPAWTPPTVSPFADVPTTHLFYAEITWLASRGITRGAVLPDGRLGFQPTDTVTRAAMAAFLYRFAGDSTFAAPAATPFPDVPTNHQFYREITWMLANGITTGTQLADSSYGYDPWAPTSRQATAAFLYRLIND
jgi:hypothetical protein